MGAQVSSGAYLCDNTSRLKVQFSDMDLIPNKDRRIFLSLKMSVLSLGPTDPTLLLGFFPIGKAARS